MENKAILMSIRPQYVAKILNGEKTIEVRKKFPKDFKGWVYIYCTKNGLPLMRCSSGKWFVKDKNYDYDMRFCYYAGYNGKVVARFWCDKVDKLETEFYIEEPLYAEEGTYQAIKRVCLEQMDLVDYDEDWCDRETLYTNEDYLNEKEETKNKFLQKCCLSGKELQKYFNKVDEGYAIHISKLEVFDKPKKLKEFRHTCKAEYRGYNCWQPCSKECKNCVCNQLDDEGYSQCFTRLTKAPESWYYIEGE